MKDSKNVKNKVWIYAIILFTSAFIVLLFTAYSQIKLNRNIVDFKSQINTQEIEKNKYQLSYTKALETLDLLTSENEKISKEKAAIAANLDAVREQAAERETAYTKKQEEYEKLSRAQSEYLTGNIAISANILKSMDKSLLATEGAALYDTFSALVYVKAGKEFFDKGYTAYIGGKYEEAASALSLSRFYATTGVYSARCLYYLAYTEYRLGNKDKALAYMNSLLVEYSDTPYWNKAKVFIKDNS